MLLRVVVLLVEAMTYNTHGINQIFHVHRLVFGIFGMHFRRIYYHAVNNSANENVILHVNRELSASLATNEIVAPVKAATTAVSTTTIAS